MKIVHVTIQEIKVEDIKDEPIELMPKTPVKKRTKL